MMSLLLLMSLSPLLLLCVQLQAQLVATSELMDVVGSGCGGGDVSV